MEKCFSSQDASRNGAFDSMKSWENFVKKMESEEGKKPSVLALSIALKRIPKLSGEITV